MRVEAAGATNPGPRQLNQDALLIDVELGLFIVADGMGGHRAGEVASRLAVEAVANFIRATSNGADITWPFPLDLTQSVAANRMSAALRLANRAVFAAGARNPEQAGMGTTLVAILVDGGRVVIGHVGDSRAYVLRRGELTQMTEDHTLLNALGLRALDALNPSMRHVLTSGIGVHADVTPALAEQQLVSGDKWLICTDGVHGYVALGDLRGVLRSMSPKDAAPEVVRCAIAAGTTDNATAVVLNVC